MEVERLVVRFVADVTQYETTLSALESRLVAFSLTATALTAASAIKMAAAYEQAEVAFSVMTGSAEKAKSLLADINKLAIETPFKSGPLVAAAQSLKSYGVETEALIPTLRVLGDVASGGGANMSLDEKLGRITLAFGQVRTAGRLMGGELRQFTEAGIPLIENLAVVMNRPTSMIKSMVEEGQVGFREVAMAFNRMTGEGGLFFNMMQKQSQTVAGRWNSFVENIQLGLRNLGLAFFKGFGLADVLNDMSEFTSGASKQMSMLEGFFGRMREVFDVFRSAASVVMELASSEIGQFMERLLGRSTDWSNVKNAIIDVMQVVLKAIGGVIEGFKIIVKLFATVILQASEFAAKAGIIGEGGKGIYTTSRESGFNKITSIFRSIGGNLHLALGLRTSEQLENIGEVVSAKNPIADFMKEVIKSMGPMSTDMMSKVFGSLQDRMIKDQLNKDAERIDREASEYLVKYFGKVPLFGSTMQRLAEQLTPGIVSTMDGSKMPIPIGLQGDAMGMVKELNKEFASGETAMSKYRKELNAINSIFEFEGIRRALMISGMFIPGGLDIPKEMLLNPEKQLRFQAGKMLEEMRKAVGTEIKFPEYATMGSQRAQDIMNFTQFGIKEQNVQEEMRALLAQMVEMEKNKEKRDIEALNALKNISKVTILGKGFGG